MSLMIVHQEAFRLTSTVSSVLLASAGSRWTRISFGFTRLLADTSHLFLHPTRARTTPGGLTSRGIAMRCST